MATFLLVHGAWGGGWCWKDVAPLLRTVGHDVYPPTLTGTGECAHLLNPTINLGTHIQNIVNVLFFEDLRDVILVGWSYAGMVITGVGEQAADRLAHLVYFDADIPHDGLSRFDLETPGERTGWEEKASDGMHALLIIEDAAAHDVIPDEVKRQWILARLSGQRQPLKTVTEPFHITHPAALALPRTYITGTVGLAVL